MSRDKENTSNLRQISAMRYLNKVKPKKYDLTINKDLVGVRYNLINRKTRLIMHTALLPYENSGRLLRYAH